MTILTVRANDTASAMEEIVEKLGTESYILDTKKVGNEMLIKATNNPIKKPRIGKGSHQKFSNMMSKELNSKLSGTDLVSRKDKKTRSGSLSQFSSQNDIDTTRIVQEMGLELQALRNALDGMVLTDMAGLSPNLQSTTKVRLQKLGFSGHVLKMFKSSIIV